MSKYYNDYLRDSRCRSIAKALLDNSPTKQQAILVAFSYVQHKVKYATDMEIYGESERWEYPYDVLVLGYADCEGQALLLTRLLLDMGADACAVYGWYEPGKQYHVWCEVTVDGKRYILDTTSSNEIVAVELGEELGYIALFDIYLTYTVMPSRSGNKTAPVAMITEVDFGGC